MNAGTGRAHVAGGRSRHDKAKDETVSRGTVAAPEKNSRRICMVLPVHLSARTGGAQYQAECIAGLLQEDPANEVFYLSGRVGPNPAARGYTLLSISRRRGRRRFGRVFQAPGLFALLSRLRPHLIYQRIGCAYTGVAAFYARRSGCRMVWHVAHDADVTPFDWRVSANLPFRWLEKRMLEYGLRHANAVIVQSERQAELLERHYGRRPTAVVLNAHPAPCESLRKGPGVEVLWVANLKAWKRPELFLRLARDLARLQGVRFTMVGSAYRESQRRARFEAELAASPNVNYLGAQSLAAVNALMARAHLFVNTSVAEGFPNTYIQAWMRAVPVVSLGVDPGGVLVRERIGVCAQSYETLRAAVEELSTHPADLQAMGRRARDYALARHSLEGMRRDLMPLLS